MSRKKNIHSIRRANNPDFMTDVFSNLSVTGSAFTEVIVGKKVHAQG
jgi:hypothetical protein